MKAILAVLLLASGVALGATSREIAVSNLPWLSDAMKAPCNKTEFEYRLAAGKVDPESVALWEGIVATRFIGTPTARGLVVQCDIAFTGTPPAPASPKYRSAIGQATYSARFKARERFCPKDAEAFVHDRNLYILGYYNGKLAGVRTEGFDRVLGPTDNEDAIVKELMSH